MTLVDLGLDDPAMFEERIKTLSATELDALHAEINQRLADMVA